MDQGMINLKSNAYDHMEKWYNYLDPDMMGGKAGKCKQLTYQLYQDNNCEVMPTDDDSV